MTIRTSRFGVLVLLLLLVAVLIGLVVTNQQQGIALGMWPRFAIDEVASIEIRVGDDNFSLVREQDGWVVRDTDAGEDVPPIPADSARIEALLSAIAHNPPMQNLGPQNPAEAASYGFDAPAVRIVIRSGAKALHDVQILLGKETPARGGVHAQCSLQPDNVLLLEASMLHQLDKHAEHYYDLRLLNLRAEEALRLSFTSGNSLVWDLERHDDAYVFNAPESLRGSSVSVSEVRLFLHNLNAVSADSMVSKPERQTNGKPQFSIAIMTVKDKPPLMIEFFSQAEGAPVYGRSTYHPLGFHMDSEKVKSLFRQTFDMQWRGVLGFDTARVERARIFAPGGNQTLVVEKTANGWESRDQGRVVQGIDIALWRLKELRVESEPVSRLVPPVEQKLVCELFGREEKPLVVFTFFVDNRLPSGQCWLKVGQEELFYPVGSQIIDDLLGHLPPRAPRPAAPTQSVEQGAGKP